MIKKLLKVVLLLLVVYSVYGQQAGDFISLKNFTPPSPEAAAFAKYGEIPVDLSTGVPQISVPLFDIKSRKLGFPISLSYHASGIKVEDIATPVGLGWVINCGGSISRTVIGKADENGLLLTNIPAYKNRSQLEGVLYNGADFGYLKDLVIGAQDAQSDIYNINCPGISGKFVYDVNRQIHFTPVDKQIQINRNANNTFTVIDDNGICYQFTDLERTENWQGGTNDITTWHLTTMISPDLADTVYFKYINASTFVDTLENHSLSINVPVNTANPATLCAKSSETWNYSIARNTYSYYRKLLDNVRFANGYVKFEYATDRQDRVNERLVKVKLGNNNGVIKEIELVHGYFQSDYDPAYVNARHSKRLRLDNVKFKDKLSNEINAWSFNYNNTALPAYSVLASPGPGLIKNTQIDFWGYYNANNSFSLLPKGYKNVIIDFLLQYYFAANMAQVNNYEYTAANRYPDPNYTQACILNKITYPTGGFTLFEYESNKIANNGLNTDYTGGVRIRRMVTFETANREPLVKTYVYGNGNGLGTPVTKRVPEDFYYTARTITRQPVGAGFIDCNSGIFNISANPVNPFNVYNGSPVFYTNITEYEGYPGDNKGKTEYIYDFDVDSIYAAPYLSKYWNFSTDRSWIRGNLLNKKAYKINGNGNYSLLQETKNEYVSLGRKVVKTGQVCELMTMPGNINSLEGYMNGANIPAGDKFLLTHFDYIDVALSYGVRKLSKTEDIEYRDNVINTKQEFFYESTHHLYLTKKELTTSNGETKTELIRYAQDKPDMQNVPATASTALDAMVAQNMKAIPIEIETQRNSTFVSKNRTEYKSWPGVNRIYEEYLSQQNRNFPLEQRIRYKSHDERGNATTLGYKDGFDNAIVWDYDKSLVTAEVKNAAEGEVAYTSFETESGGNWSIPVATRYTNAYLTGQKAYNLSWGNITRNGLTPSKSYLVTYWSQNGSALVNGATGTSKVVKNHWTLFEHILTAPGSSVSVSGSVIIDELRLHPRDAQMTSFNYIPLVGISSANTPANMISYYEYDSYGRLKVIRDMDNNIIKLFNYTYNESLAASVGWKPTGNTGGLTGIGGYGKGFIAKEERNVDPASPDYNHTRWVAIDIIYVNPAWIATGQTQCEKDGSNQNTGYQVDEYEDRNPYSNGYKQKKWVRSIYNTTSCPSQQPCEGPDKKIINGNCETGIKKYRSTYFNGVNWTCVYYYEWSDQSISQDYEETNSDPCSND
jgi:hypothetical protein